MLFLVGSVIVIGCVLGGFAAMGGNLLVLAQPFEAVIIVGAAIGAYVISTPSAVLRQSWHALSLAVRGPRHGKAANVELLSLLFAVFRLIRTKGLLALEMHVEDADQSPLFQQFPIVAADAGTMTFLRDYLRLMMFDSANVYEVAQLMEDELENHEGETARLHHALQNMADGMPALGIVAAVLGVIKTMGSITEPPEVLGHLIGGALVGTFLGVWLSYGFIGPIAAAVKAAHEADGRFLHCIKAGLIAHMHGLPPAVSVEFARKALLEETRPTFYEIEDATSRIGMA